MFDSGVGGLTVARAHIDLLPHEHLIYFGDTAHCPYGPRPLEEVRKFALEITDALVEEDVKMLVVACNSAASAALDEMRERYVVPIVSVIEPAVKSAIAISRNRRIGLIGTEATVNSGAYEHAVGDTKANVILIAQACPRFVEFVERGDTSSDELLEVARICDVATHRKRSEAIRLPYQHVPPACQHGDVGALCGERLCAREADARGRAADDRGTPAQAEIHQEERTATTSRTASADARSASCSASSRSSSTICSIPPAPSRTGTPM